MRKINRFCWLAALPLAFTACQNQDLMPDEPVVGKSGTVEATIGKQIQTRAQVEYGNEDETKGELFMWNNKDVFLLYDVSQKDKSMHMQYRISNSYDESSPSSHATFVPSTPYSFTSGHNMVAFLGTNAGGFDFSDNTVTLGSVYSNTEIQIASNTPGNADVAHLKGNLPLYATATIKEDGSMPALTFHHLSSLFRYSLTNRMNSDVQIKKVTVEMEEEYFVTSADIAITGAGVVSIPNKSLTSDTHTLEFVNANGDPYATIASGKTYNGYSAFIPDKNVTFGTGETLSFTVTTTNGASNTITLDASKIAAANGGIQHFEMGKRYWFDLTIDTDGTLKWTKDVAK